MRLVRSECITLKLIKKSPRCTWAKERFQSEGLQECGCQLDRTGQERVSSLLDQTLLVSAVLGFE